MYEKTEFEVVGE